MPFSSNSYPGGWGRSADAPRDFAPQPQYVAAICCLITFAIAVIDMQVPAHVIIPVGYAIPLALSVWAHSLKLLWGILAFAVVGTLTTYYFGQAPSTPAGIHIALINRSLVGAVLFVLAISVHRRIGTVSLLMEREHALEKQTAEMEIVNDELRQREEEIVRQNEELHSQTEELERQTEELRITNEELAARERSLEQLLELSRSLTSELTRSELTDKICEALGALTEGIASAIVERRGNELEVVCHHGFGPAGLRQTTQAAADSFSSLIMSMGQTGFLEDVRLRPELAIPTPAEGEPFLSVLATPLRIQGRAIGTMEIYSIQPRSWDATQVSLIESLAAQSSISLQNLELIEAIQQERRRFEAAFRTVPFGMAITDDPEAKEVQLNPAAAAMLGVPLGENVAQGTPAGTRIRRAITRNRIPLLNSEFPLSRALRGEDVLGEDLEIALPKGTIAILACAAPVYDNKGQVIGAVSSFADITELKSLQRELDLRRREAEEASVRKTRFLAAVSHDIRTPANAISLMAELIKRSCGNAELSKEIPHLAAQLQANTKALMDLVGDVLDVARFDSGKVELVENEFPLSELLADECRQVKPLAQDKGLQLILEPLERPIWVHTDRVKLGRVLGNLLGNGIKFTSQGSVILSASILPHPDRRLVICVTDTGIGIEPEQLSQIFDEFAQLHNPERDRSKGTGLGLAICKRLVEVMGGQIAVQSQPNKGTVFQVILSSATVVVRLDATYGTPLVEHMSKAASSSSLRLAGLHVLLVEDHASTRDGTARILRQEGAVVTEAHDGRAALDALKSVKIQVVLLDMMLPDVDGREVLKEIQSNPPVGLKGILVLTGDLTRERLSEIKQFGADGLIGKPVDIFKLISALESCCKSHI